jgi:nicotinate phosphoribosyltransferase
MDHSSDRGAFVSGPLITARCRAVETAVINFVHLQTLLASKAVRWVLAAQGRAIVDFGLRRTPGIDAGMKAARCAFIAGATTTSNVLAGLYEGIPRASPATIAIPSSRVRDSCRSSGS